MDLLAVVPDDRAVRLSTAAGKPLEVYAPSCPAAQAYRQLEANLTDGVLPPQRSDRSTSPAPEPAPEPEASEDEPAPEDGADEDSSQETGDVAKPGLFARLLRRVAP